MVNLRYTIVASLLVMTVTLTTANQPHLRRSFLVSLPEGGGGVVRRGKVLMSSAFRPVEYGPQPAASSE